MIVTMAMIVSTSSAGDHHDGRDASADYAAGADDGNRRRAI
jgi:hypothetical protein